MDDSMDDYEVDVSDGYEPVAPKPAVRDTVNALNCANTDSHV